MYLFFSALLLCVFTTPLLAKPPSKDLYTVPDKRWGILFYHSWMTNSNIGLVLTAQDVHCKYGTMNSICLIN